MADHHKTLVLLSCIFLLMTPMHSALFRTGEHPFGLIMPKENHSPQKRVTLTGTLKALSYISGATCLGVMAANVDCNGMQKTNCELAEDIEQLAKDAKVKAKNATDTGAYYQYLVNIYKTADYRLSQIDADLEDLTNDTTEILTTLSTTQKTLVTADDAYILPEEVFQYNSEVNDFVFNLSTPIDSKVSFIKLSSKTIGLAINMMPYVGQVAEWVIRMTIYPKVQDLEMYFIRRGSLYGVQGSVLYEVSTTSSHPLRKASFVEVNHFERIESVSIWEAALSEYETLAATRVFVIINNISRLVGSVLCGFTIAEIVKKTEQAESELRDVKQQLTSYNAELDETLEKLWYIRDNMTAVVDKYVTNTDILMNSLVSSEQFSTTGPEDLRNTIQTLSDTPTTYSNMDTKLTAIQSYIAAVKATNKDTLNSVKLVQKVLLDVQSSVSVQDMYDSAYIYGIITTDKFQIYMIIATYTDKDSYDGVNLACIRSYDIKNQAQLDSYLASRALSTTVSYAAQQQIISMAMATLPVTTIMQVVETVHRIGVQDTDVLTIIANSDEFSDQSTYTDYTGGSASLTSYRQSSCYILVTAGPGPISEP